MAFVGYLGIFSDLTKRCHECGRKGVAFHDCTGFVVPEGVKADLCIRCEKKRVDYYHAHEKPKPFKKASRLKILGLWIIGR